jgi:hypothetical protein
MTSCVRCGMLRCVPPHCDGGLELKSLARR